MSASISGDGRVHGAAVTRPGDASGNQDRAPPEICDLAHRTAVGGEIQTLVVDPSLSGAAIHRSSGESVLPVGYQGIREAAYPFRRTPSPSGGLALKISFTWFAPRNE